MLGKGAIYNRAKSLGKPQMESIKCQFRAASSGLISTGRPR